MSATKTMNSQVRAVGLDLQVPGTRFRIVVESVMGRSKVTVDWLTGAALSVGYWEEGDPIVEVAKRFDLARKIGDAAKIRAERVVLDV